MTAALVTDAHVRSAVWFVRGLTAAGVPTVAVDARRLAAGRWSRGIAERARAPDPVRDPRGFRAALHRLGARHGGAVVYPVKEETIDALLAAPPLEPPVSLPYPEAVSAVRDKSGVSAAAEHAGLRPPAIRHAGPVGDVTRDGVDFPLVLKPARKGTALDRAHVIHDARELDATLARLPADEDVLLQEYVPGQLKAVAVVVDREGGLAASIQQVATSTWPAEAGPSRVAVSVPPDADLADRSRALLARLGYWGLAELQFIASPDGPRLIDVNPRAYGSIGLALAAGVNLPAVWHAVATGAEVRPVNGYRAGVTYRWLEGELYAAGRGHLSGLLRRAPAPRVGAFWSRRDPVPAALLTADAGGRFLARQARRATGRL